MKVPKTGGRKKTTDEKQEAKNMDFEGEHNLSQEAQRIRTRVVLEADRVEFSASSDYPGEYAGVDDSWSFEKFKSRFRVEITKIDHGNEEGNMKKLGRSHEKIIEFDLIGVDASLANALRRILIAEIPTVAIEHVFIMNNTSLVQDEVLSHRLGLVPIYCDPHKFEFKSPEEDPTDLNTVVFKLSVKCEKNPLAPSLNSSRLEDKYIDSSVFSRSLIWQPQGSQAELFSADPIRPVHDDILLAKLRPGQEIECELHCEKGIGKEHIKWSPVGTASYRLLPEIILKRDFYDEEAHQLEKCFSPGVIHLKSVTVDGAPRTKAVVADPRRCVMTREVFRHANLADAVLLQRVRDHYLFFIESVGFVEPSVLFLDSIQLLKEKSQRILAALDLQTSLSSPDQTEPAMVVT
eukprot:Sdes_comp9797_c0_seq1m1330